MARGVASPAPVVLPKVAFTRVQEDASTQPSGVHDLQARSYGYNDFSEFRRPEHYIRYIEPLESDLAVQVEYDMDEQDQEWLDAVNTERKKEQIDKVSYEVFEIIMDRLEKEWFDLTKNIPKPDLALPSEDSTCAICDDSEGENTNAIVFCDGCNLAVHQDCYGVPYIPEGQWLCRKCTVSPENPVSCILCPNEGGAFKQTVHGEWVHLLCAIWVPETRVANDVFMEPVTGVDKISKQRWKLKCSVCDIREGACIQCTKASCFLAFHATCARKERLLMPMKASQGSEAPALACYCAKHLPKEQLEARAIALAAETSDGAESDALTSSPKSSKTARAYAKTYKPGPPLVPHIIVERILLYISKVMIRQKREFVLLVCKYWSLKREARRGAPLLKRLHLEPWTASTVNRQHNDEEKAKKLEYTKRLRADLERLRVLADLIKKRESRKREQAEISQDVFSHFLFPYEPHLRMAFEKIMGMDRQDMFKNPVSKVDVPDYFDVIKNPMCWSTIDQKLDRHEYWDLQSFKDDVNLVLTNAILYNKPGTPFYKAAQRIMNAAEPVLADLNKYTHEHVSLPESEELPDSSTDFTKPPRPPIGDLEPPSDLLELLVSEDAIKDSMDLILGTEPIESLFRYEFAKIKLPPAPKPKRDRRADRERARLLREAEMEASPGLRARTRRSAAAAAVFGAETVSATPEAAVAGPSASAEEQRAVEEAAVPAAEPTVGKRGKRLSVAHPEVPPMVDHVNSQQSFKMFDAGWILPPDQRRGGRAPVEKHAIPPPRKKARTEREKSHLSTFSTSAAENETLRSSSVARSVERPRSSPPPVVPAEVQARSEEPMVVDRAETREPSAPREPEAPEPPEEAEEEKPGVRARRVRVAPIVIEELDTPATRREKAQRRRAEKKRQAEAEAAAVEATKEPQPVAGPSRRPEVAPADVDVDMQSELSSLSELSDDDGDEDQSAAEHAAAPKPAVKAPAEKSAPDKEPGAVVLQEGEMLEGGTLVWAKSATYPWWPAVIFELDDPAVPDHILERGESMSKTGKGPLHLLRFYDTHNSWAWLEPEKLRMLHEDEVLDAEMLAANSKRQRWKSVGIRNACRDAYRRAMAEMETERNAKDEEPTSSQAASLTGTDADSPMTEI